MLAIRLARHTKDGWENAAIPDDVRDISQLLNLKPASALKLLHELDSRELPTCCPWRCRPSAQLRVRLKTSSKMGR